MKNELMENFITNSILTYPMLNLNKNFDDSVIRVLDHLYFVIGNGYEWKDGFPIGVLYIDKKNKQEIRINKYKKIDISELFSKNFYVVDKEDAIYKFNLPKNILEDMKKNSYKKFNNDICYYFEDEDFIKNLNNKYNGIADNTSSFIRFNERCCYTPYPIYNHSRIHEMAYGEYDPFKNTYKKIDYHNDNLTYAKIVLDRAYDFYQNINEIKKRKRISINFTEAEVKKQIKTIESIKGILNI